MDVPPLQMSRQGRGELVASPEGTLLKPCADTDLHDLPRTGRKRTPAVRTSASEWQARDVEYYARGGRALLGLHAAELITGFVTAYILTNFTSPETYATFGYVIAVLAVASVATLPGVDAAVLQGAARGYPGVLEHGTRLRFRASFVGLAGMLLWAGGLYWAGRTREALAVAGAGVLVPFLYPFATVFPFLQGKKRFAEYAWAHVAIEVAKSASVAIVVLLLSWSSTAVVLTPFVIMSLGYSAVNRRYRAATGAGPGREFDRASCLLTGTAALGVVAGQVDRLVVGTFFAPAAMAAYNLGVTLTYPLRGLGSLGSKLLLPRILELDATAPGFRRRYGLCLAATAIVLVAIAATYWIAFPVIQPLLFPGYSESAPIVRWLALAMALGAFDLVAVQALWGLRDLRAYYLTQSLFPIQRIVLLAIGAWLAGVRGILAAQVAHYVLSGVAILLLWVKAAPRRASA
jgi:O-antigen/teichoic acid export membrane protein